MTNRQSFSSTDVDDSGATKYRLLPTRNDTMGTAKPIVKRAFEGEKEEISFNNIACIGPN